MNLSKTALVTHRACMDGSACVILFLALGGKQENVFYSDPGANKVDRVVKRALLELAGPIMIADVAISEQLADELDDTERAVVLLDHHRNSVPLNRFDWCEIEVDNQRCGSMMLYEQLERTLRKEIANLHEHAFAHPGDPRTQLTRLLEYRSLIQLVDVRDRWVVDGDPAAQTISTFHIVIGQKLFVERFFKKPTTFLFNEEKYLVDMVERKKVDYIEKVKKHIRIVDTESGGVKIRVAFMMANDHQSELGYSVTHDPDLDVDIAVMVGSFSVALRSHEDCPVDLSQLARLNDPHGGGHRCASGFSLSRVLDGEIIDIVKEKMRF